MNKLQALLAVAAFAACLHMTSSRGVENKSPFIVGGEPTTISDHPHHLALIDMVRGGPSGYMCGASNIHRLWALTAAHCVDFGTPAELVNLWGGSTSRISGGHLFFVRRYVLHPGYNRATVDLDIAIIEVDVRWEYWISFQELIGKIFTAWNSSRRIPARHSHRDSSDLQYRLLWSLPGRLTNCCGRLGTSWRR